MTHRPALLALAAGTLLASPAGATQVEHYPRFERKTPTPCYAYQTAPVTLAEREERVFRCGPPRRVQVCEPAYVPQWNAVVDRCSIRDDWSNTPSVSGH